MKRIAQLAALLLLSNMAFAVSWYVDPTNGGTRYSAANPTGQCNGHGSAAYVSGVNQPCPYKLGTMLWNDQSVNADSNWVIAAGDVVTFLGTVPVQVSGSQNASGGNPCFGIGPTCSPPDMPSGSSGEHIVFRGQNAGSCETRDATGFLIADPAKTAYLWAGNGSFTAFQVQATQYVDFQCLDISDHSSCNGINLSCAGTDYSSIGIYTGNTVPAVNGNITLTDVKIHGFQSRGLRGNLGGPWTLYAVEIFGNGSAGWDLDPGSSQDSHNAVMNMTWTGIDWNGCSEEYPAVDPIPIQTGSCTDDSSGGYGDGIGTPSDVGILSFTFNHSRATFNTQDGTDFGHMILGNGTFSNSYFQGNMGGNVKGGQLTSMVVSNNLINGNCRRMSAPITGVPSGYNTNLTDFCRASDQNSFNFNASAASATWQFNTMVGYGATMLDVTCLVNPCASSTFLFRDNVMLGYSEASYNTGQLPGGFYGFPPTTQDHNLMYNMRGCQANTGDVSPTCILSPAFTGQPASPITVESQLDNYNFHPAAGSPLIASGVTVSGLGTDFYGALRPASPSVGAVQFGGVVNLPTIILNGSIIGSGTWQ